ncbi:hypothetical protein SH661x_001839 [Planctomicrobium sp. SH661]|uniref:hypothetical protein n=1 Tax=Planctomicrobium sp. SH661 TaxID=3448124 RepID=UPI003F5CA051
MLEFSLDAIRQFLTHHERLEAAASRMPPGSDISDFRRPPDIRQDYFEALELLRGHLGQCVHQIAIIASVELPKVPDNLRDGWRLSSYVMPQSQAAQGEP